VGHYPFTFFNAATVLVAAMALSIVTAHFRERFHGIWPLLCFAAMLGYALGFSGSLNLYWVAFGALAAAAIRLNFYPSYVRYAEFLALGYVVGRCAELLLML
jgi:hypothetical protein